jgi:hypothetical protein
VPRGPRARLLWGGRERRLLGARRVPACWTPRPRDALRPAAVWGDCLLPSPVEKAAAACASRGGAAAARCRELGPACQWLPSPQAAPAPGPGGRCGVTDVGVTVALFGAASRAVEGAVLCSAQRDAGECAAAGTADVDAAHIRALASGVLRELARGAGEARQAGTLPGAPGG